mmetsp:Transcript_52533/g.85017  ORF Transcript_52533/g.85017 Transcript_52533/m.85017 type:complete len:87 (+) Transcript_52533:3710-3970(+)
MAAEGLSDAIARHSHHLRLHTESALQSFGLAALSRWHALQTACFADGMLCSMPRLAHKQLKHLCPNQGLTLAVLPLLEVGGGCSFV